MAGKTDKDSREALAKCSNLPRQCLKGRASLVKTHAVGTDRSADLTSGPGRSCDARSADLVLQQAPGMFPEGLKPTRRNMERGFLGRYGFLWVALGR